MARGVIRTHGRFTTIASATLVALLLLFAGSARAANFTVTSTAPSGAGSLAEAVSLANADTATADTITITATGTINPASPIGIFGSTEIDGPGARSLTIDGQGTQRLFVTNGSPTLTLTGLTLANAFNNQNLYYGSAILARDGGQVILRNTAVLNNINTAAGANDALGGAIYSRGPLTIENSTVAGNKSLSATGTAVGGAFYAPSGATIRTSTIVNNVAMGGNSAGGGPYLDGPGFNSVIRNSTIASNSAAIGANVAIGAGHIISFRDDILSSPLGGGGSCNASNTAAVTSEGFNLVSDATCGITQISDLAGDPQLGPLADNGGPTDTMLPAATSPVIDHGTSSGLTADQRGLPRPADVPSVANALGSDGTDIGAVEIQPAVTPPPAPPAGDVALGKVQLNKAKGTATILTTVNGAGTVALAGKTVKKATAKPTVAGKVKLTIKAAGKAKRALKKGKAKVSFTVTFTPSSGGAVDTAKRSVTLKLAPKPQHHRH